MIKFFNFSNIEIVNKMIITWYNFMHKTIENLNYIKNQINLNYKKNFEIIAVSKTFSIDHIQPLIDYGHLHYGENKVQEAIKKWTEIKNKYMDIKLHMIGNLQTNKVKQAIKLFDFIHSLSSDKLAKKIATEQLSLNKKTKIFIQVNIDNEEQKNGVYPNDLYDLYYYCTVELRLDIIGLMCIPSTKSDPKKSFLKMKNLADKLNLKELSMGMSSDYLEAINQGSTFIRVGSKIFGNRS